jgi:glycosyltransferase involved in cell wall biosynthesis
MKVLFITNMYPTIGHPFYGIHVKEQIDAVVASGGIDHRVLFINGKKNKLNYLLGIPRLFIVMQSQRFDLIHVHYGLTGLVLLLFPFLTIPVVLTLHGSDINAPDWITKFVVTKILPRCRRVIVVNSQMVSLVQTLNSSIEVIPCGVDVNLFRPTHISYHQTFRIGFPSDPSRPEKNYPLFESMIKLLVGNGLKIETVVFDKLARLQVVNKLNYIDVLVLTSFNEGSPQIVKEALACNTPVISVPVGDVRELLDGVDKCRISDNFEPESLAALVLGILQHGSRKSEGGRQKLLALGLDEQSIARRLLDCYRSLLQSPATSLERVKRP